MVTLWLFYFYTIIWTLSDDDINYLVANLKLLEDYGYNFTSDNVLENWLVSIPPLHACTAERVAIQNALNQKWAPLSATNQNPYREWIGAQIRADIFGIINPLNLENAMKMAYVEASASHTKNGVYGAMLVAGLLSQSYSDDSALEITKRVVGSLPNSSRLVEQLEVVLGMYENKQSFEEVIEDIHSKYNESIFYDWCHVIPNAMIVVACYLYFNDDFDKAIINSVTVGFDTDCNGATVGALVGLYRGVNAIDKKWKVDILDTINTSVSRYYSMSQEELIERIHDVTIIEQWNFGEKSEYIVRNLN